MQCWMYATVLIIIAICTSQSRGKLVLESCEPAAAECPENSDCRSRDCDGLICLCYEGFAPNRDNTICKRTVTLDQPCDDLVQCKDVFSVCVAGSCKCKQGYASSIDNVNCKSKTVFGNSYALLGEPCDTNTVCTQQHEQECKDGVCACLAGLREASPDELAAYPFSRFECRPDGYNMSQMPEDCNNTDVTSGLVKVSEACMGDANCPLNGECVDICSTSECRCKLGYVPNDDDDACMKVVAIGELCDPTTTICVDVASNCTDNTCQCVTAYSVHDNFGESDLSCQLSNVNVIAFVGYNESCTGVQVLCISGLSCASGSCQCAPGTSYISSEYRLRNPKLIGVCQADMATFNQNSCPAVTEAPRGTDPTDAQVVQTDAPTIQTNATDAPTIQTNATDAPTIQTDTPTIQTDATTPVVDDISPSITTDDATVETVPTGGDTPAATDAPTDPPETASVTATDVATDGTTAEAVVVKLGAACDNTTNLMCPENSNCEVDACEYNRCRCSPGLFPVNDDTECGEGVILGESCDSSTRCLVSGSFCTSAGVCECRGFSRSSADNLGCLPVDVGTQKWAAFGESCVGKICYISFELVCNVTTDLCDCKDGNREKTEAERKDTFPNSMRCVPKDYSVVQSAFPCPRIAEPEEPEVGEPSNLPLAFGLTMSVVCVAALAFATIAWRRVRRRRRDTNEENIELSREQDTVLSNGGALFRGDNSWTDNRRPYFYPVTNI